MHKSACVAGKVWYECEVRKWLGRHGANCERMCKSVWVAGKVQGKGAGERCMGGGDLSEELEKFPAGFPIDFICGKLTG